MPVNSKHKSDSTYRMQAMMEVAEDGKTVYLDVQTDSVLAAAKQITLAERMRNEAHATITEPKNVKKIMMFSTVYGSVTLYMLIFLSIVNIRWNRAFKRIQKLWGNIENIPENNKIMGKLEMQKLSLFDRYIVYIVFLSGSMLIDALIYSYGYFNVPLIILPTTLFIVYKIQKRLAEGSRLKGMNDDDIISNFKEVGESMLLKPIIASVSSIIKNAIDNLIKTPEKKEP